MYLYNLPSKDKATVEKHQSNPDVSLISSGLNPLKRNQTTSFSVRKIGEVCLEQRRSQTNSYYYALYHHT